MHVTGLERGCRKHALDHCRRPRGTPSGRRVLKHGQLTRASSCGARQTLPRGSRCRGSCGRSTRRRGELADAHVDHVVGVFQHVAGDVLLGAGKTVRLRKQFDDCHVTDLPLRVTYRFTCAYMVRNTVGVSARSASTPRWTGSSESRAMELGAGEVILARDELSNPRAKTSSSAPSPRGIPRACVWPVCRVLPQGRGPA